MVLMDVVGPTTDTLHQAYDWSYEVLQHEDKTFIIKTHDKNVTATTDRLKPAYTVIDNDQDQSDKFSYRHRRITGVAHDFTHHLTRV